MINRLNYINVYVCVLVYVYIIYDCIYMLNCEDLYLCCK